MTRYDRLIHDSKVDFGAVEKVELVLPEARLVYSGEKWLVDDVWSFGTIAIPIPTKENPEPWLVERFVGAQHGSGDISVEQFQTIYGDMDDFENADIDSDGCAKRAIPPKTLVMRITYPDVKTSTVTGEMGGEMLVGLTEDEKGDPEFMKAVDLLLGEDEEKRKAFFGR